jgi:hypothetical protein
MKIVIPDTFDDTIPPGEYELAIENVSVRESRSGNPKLVVKWCVVNDDERAGAAIFEHYSLLPQALWKLNNLYRTVTGEKLPSGAFSIDEFISLMQEKLCGARFKAVVGETISENGNVSNEITEREFIG